MYVLNLLTDFFVFNGKEYQNYIEIFGIKIMFYAIAIVTGMLVCMIVARPAMKRMGLDPDIEFDMMILVIPLCIVGARTWYVLFDLGNYDSFWDVINIRNGGLAIYGGVMGGALAVFILSKIKKISFLKLADIGSIMLPLGQAIGRLGNYFNQEVYGNISKLEFFPISVYITAEGSYRYALFLFEGILNICLFTTLYILAMKKKIEKPGYYMCFYFIGYGLFRFILEPLRDPKYNMMFLGIRSQVLFSFFVIVLGIIVLVLLLKRDKKLFFREKKLNGEFIEDLNIDEKDVEDKL